MADTSFVNGVTLTDAGWFQDVNDLVYSGPASAAITNAVSTFTGTLTGCTTAPTFSIKYTKIGDLVILLVPRPITALTSNATTKTLTGMPASIRPAATVTFYSTSFASDNGGAQVPGCVIIPSTGVIDLRSTFNGTAWTASGTCNFGDFIVMYTTA